MKIDNFLLEMSGSPRTLWHFTNPAALFGILKSGKVLGSLFDVSVDTHVRKTENREQRPELATVRPSSNLAKIPGALSNQVGSVKLIISPHIMSDKVRRVKVTPIAEFPLQFNQNIDEVLQEYPVTGDKKKRSGFIRAYLKWYGAHNYEPKYDPLTREVVRYGKYSQQTDKRLKDLQKFFKDSFGENLTDKDANDIDINAADYLFYASSGREGEERISKPSGEIPLDKSYIKIELQNGFTKSFADDLGNIDFLDYNGFILSKDYDPDADRHNYVKHSKEMRRFLTEWKFLLNKNQEVFIKNKEFISFNATLNELIQDATIKGTTPKTVRAKKQVTSVLRQSKIKPKVTKHRLYVDKVPSKIKDAGELKKYTGIEFHGKEFTP